MISPGGGVSAAHLQDVHHNAMDSAVRVAPDVVEDTACPDMGQCGLKFCLNSCLSHFDFI